MYGMMWLSDRLLAKCFSIMAHLANWHTTPDVGQSQLLAVPATQKLICAAFRASNGLSVCAGGMQSLGATQTSTAAPKPAASASAAASAAPTDSAPADSAPAGSSHAPPAPSAAASGEPASASSQPALSEPAAAPASTPASADQAQSSGRKAGTEAPSGQANSAQASLSRPSPAPAQGAEQPRQPSQQSGHTSSGDRGPMPMHSQNGQLQVQPSV